MRYLWSSLTVRCRVNQLTNSPVFFGFNRRRLLVPIVVVCSIAGACTRPGYRSVEKPHSELPPELQLEKQAVAGNFSSQAELKFDSAAVQTFLNHYPKFADYAPSLLQFYRKRNFAFAWYDRRGLIEQAGSLYN